VAAPNVDCLDAKSPRTHSADDLFTSPDTQTDILESLFQATVATRAALLTPRLPLVERDAGRKER
jgi:hypothetical protein